MNILLASMLRRRNLTPDFFETLDEPVTDKLANIDVLVAKLRNIYNAQAPLVILPDFDMDGIMSGVLGLAGFAELGFKVSLFEPDPKEGYGFGPETIHRLVTQAPSTKAIITCDTGVSAHQGIAYAKSLGLEVLVTDHHTQRESDLLQAQPDVLVDPAAIADNYEFPTICGAYVLWKCLHEYAEHFASQPERTSIDRLRVFAGIGTVSDSMLLMRENRQLVRDAITLCKFIYNSDRPDIVESFEGVPLYRNAFRGLFDIFHVLHEKGKLYRADEINETFFGFKLAPMFNCVKRMDMPTRAAFAPFFNFNTMERKQAIETLFDANALRKDLVDEYLDQMRTSLQPYAPYVWFTSAPAGFRGLLAMRLLSDTGYPTIVVAPESNGLIKGSGRFPDWISAVGDPSLKGKFNFAGHPGAFGATFKDMYDVINYFQLMSEIIPERKAVADADPSRLKYDYFISSVDLDADSPIDLDVFYEFLEEIKKYGPFGTGNRAPVGKLTFDPRSAELSQFPAKNNRPPHLSALLPRGLKVNMWNNARFYDQMKHSSKVTVYGELAQMGRGVDDFGRPSIAFSVNGDPELG